VKTILNWREKFRENPEGTGLVIGGLIGAAVALSVAIISLLLNHADVVASPGGGEAHYGLLIGRFRVMDPPGFGLMDPPCMGYRRSRGLRVLRVLFL
jgi:hypothetical protein